MNQPPIQKLSDLFGNLLDKVYGQQIKPLLNTLSRDPRLSAALLAFSDEANRLDKAKSFLTSTNPALSHLRDTLEKVLSRQTSRIEVVGQNLQQNAIQAAQAASKQLAFPGLDNQHMQIIGVQWNVPDPDAVLRLANYAQSPAWNEALDDYGPNVAKKVYNIAVVGMVGGQNPREIARTVTQAVDAISRSEAEKMIRTLQLTSYRQAMAANYAANDDKIDHLIRIEALDDRTCLSCLALHGSRLEVGESVDEHWNGRGTAIPVIKGFDRHIQTGEDWLTDLEEDRQRKIMGDAAYNAWSVGAVNLDDFVEHTTDPIFGDMIQEASLKGILGSDEAKKYYAANYKN